MTESRETACDPAALADYMRDFEALARAQGLDYYPVDFELVPASFMTEVAVYGLPVRMPHWSFGVRFVYQYIQHRMGGSRIFEVVFPGNPNLAYLVTQNDLAENLLVTAHVLGHADFSKNNHLFQRMQAQVGRQPVEQAAERAHRIQSAIDVHGAARVEAVLDAALALEQNVDLRRDIHRPDYPPPSAEAVAPSKGFVERYRTLPGESPPAASAQPGREPLPPYPEFDLLWFIACYGPDLEDWERDIFLAVREESFYFHPVFACQIMNEGWASYWHARLLREAGFVPAGLYLDAVKSHSDVVRPYAGQDGIALAINPYHVGFVLWERVVEQHGLERAFRIRCEEDDFSFIRNHLDQAAAEALQLFRYRRQPSLPGEEIYLIEEHDLDALKEEILRPKFNFGAPRIRVEHLGLDGSLHLAHEHAADGRGLDLERAQRVLEYIQRLWRRPVRLSTVDAKGDPCELAVPGEGPA